MKLTVRLRERTGEERLQRGERYVIEAGYEGRRNDKEKGGMVAVYFSSDEQLSDALETLAAMWAKHRRNCVEESLQSRIIVGSMQ